MVSAGEQTQCVLSALLWRCSSQKTGCTGRKRLAQSTAANNRMRISGFVKVTRQSPHSKKPPGYSLSPEVSTGPSPATR